MTTIQELEAAARSAKQGPPSYDPDRAQISKLADMLLSAAEELRLKENVIRSLAERVEAQSSLLSLRSEANPGKKWLESAEEDYARVAKAIHLEHRLDPALTRDLKECLAAIRADERAKCLATCPVK